MQLSGLQPGKFRNFTVDGTDQGKTNGYHYMTLHALLRNCADDVALNFGLRLLAVPHGLLFWLIPWRTFLAEIRCGKNYSVTQSSKYR